MKLFLSLLFCAVSFSALAQTDPYQLQLKKYQADYVASHEVVKKEDSQFFRFYNVDEKYRVIATFTKLEDNKGFTMKTSGASTQHFYHYGLVNFKFDSKDIQLTIYRSQALMNNEEYKDYLFLPFTDLTSGEDSYGGGRYLDFRMGDIKNNSLIIDFNKAYNPYCAYASGFNCPIPPRENDMQVAI